MPACKSSKWTALEKSQNSQSDTTPCYVPQFYWALVLATNEDEEERRKEKIKRERKATNKLEAIFRSIDLDNSGTISLEELMDGFDTNSDMQNVFSQGLSSCCYNLHGICAVCP